VTVTDKEKLAQLVEANRAHLRAVAYRMLGSRAEADDAVQEAFLRFTRTDASTVENLGGWLTTVIARICLDMLRERKTRQEVPVDDEAEALPAPDDPERENQIADTVGVAMLMVLETLTPAERVAFVLHDIFNVSFDEIASVVGRSPGAARQLASRGRRRIQGASPDLEADRERRREVLQAFLAASQQGDFAALLALLDPDVVLRADATAVTASIARSAQDGSPPLAAEIEGREPVAAIFRNRAKAARVGSVDGEPALIFVFGGQLRIIVELMIINSAIAELTFIADPDRIAALNIRL
jgi:RNA polymerase sigma-70 factor (ECF subfamily)